MSKNVKNNPYKMESLERRYMMDGNQWNDEIHTAASALFNGVISDAVHKFNTLQNQIASQLNDPDAGLSGNVRQDGEIVSVDKVTLLSVLAA
ncbi:hypothetical protein [Hallerella succinigenes]|uniref:Uncharacterized protein n=1 Tax=Hallerella succinigenes TaxID=1896222 RepID=A0A2M9A9A5_9BACT|nr:hypothetical protein [Hallerella succinigenes]PJJ42295.1 hypothetical protein BGX16_2320 [Hallerella succinigenes]